MKKLLAILMMMLFVGCATAASERCNAPAPTPLVQTQEEVLQKAKIEYQFNLFTDWWAQELILFQGFLSSRSGVPIDIITIDMKFMDNFNICIVQIVIMSPLIVEKAFIIVTKDFDTWKINAIVTIDRSSEEKLETKEEGLEVQDNYDYQF